VDIGEVLLRFGKVVEVTLAGNFAGIVLVITFK
jgi:hypothetical protein